GIKVPASRKTVLTPNFGIESPLGPGGSYLDVSPQNDTDKSGRNGKGEVEIGPKAPQVQAPLCI
ncbi:unnamed protein product, partial [Heterosigma akashiwo]